MNYLIVILMSVAAMAVDEEMLLQRKATLLLKRSHVKNLHLIGVDPKTCKPTEKNETLVTQLNQITSDALNHCESSVQEKLRAIDEEIKNVNDGKLTFNAVPLASPIVSSVTEEVVDQNYVEERFSNEEQEFTPLEDSESIPTDEEKILSHAERNKEDYKATDEDGLFDLLSKAYVRNLNKVWMKKKTDE